MKPLIISAAITGSARPGSRSEFHPVRFDDVVSQAFDAWGAGAAMLHLHARLPDGTATGDLDASRHLVAALRAQGCDAIISLSGGDNGATASPAQRIAVPAAGSDLVTLSAGSFNMGQRRYDNSPAFLQQLAANMQCHRIRPEIEVIDTGHIHGIENLIDQGLLTGPYLFNLVFGIPGGFPCEPGLLPMVLKLLPSPFEWMVSCQTSDSAIAQRFAFEAFTCGGHVRTGLEDCMFVRPRELATSNAQMVAQWVDTSRIWGRSVATPMQAREMLGLPSLTRPARSQDDLIQENS